MRYVLIALGVLVALILAIVVIGMLLPTKHRAGREATYNRPVAEVFRVINTPADFPNWRTGVSKVEVLPANNPVFRFVSRFVIGHTATIDRFLRDLGKRLGQQEVVISDVVLR